MLLLRDFLNSSSSNPSLISSPQPFYEQFPYNNGSSSLPSSTCCSCASSSPLHISSGFSACCLVNSCNGVVGSSSNALNHTHQNCEVKSSETDNDSEFFPREPSDSGLLEEVISRFFPNSKSKKRESSPPKTETLSFSESLPPLPLTDMFVSTTQGYDETRRGFTTNEPFVVSLDQQGLPMQQFDSFNGFNPTQAMEYGSDQLMLMSDLDCSMVGDVFQHSDLLTSFAARMQNA
ncbi:hypothetical protein L6164_020538 [Bauhinia variegata]|nr:hypothetical protein L6164_020538 [Bauhinia variegata]